MTKQTIYLMLKIRYIEKLGYDPNDNTNDIYLFPNKWFLSEDYDTKIDILVEAIEKGIMIKDTEKYNNLFNEHIYT